MSSWTTCRLGDICRFQAGSAFPKKYQGMTQGEIPFIKVSDMSYNANLVYIVSSANWISKELQLKIKAKTIPEGAVVFAKIGEAVKAERYRIITRPTCIDNNMMAAIATNVHQRYFRYLLETVHLSSFIEGSALPYLRQADLLKIEVSIPSLSEQRGIAATLGALDDKIESNRRALNKAQDLLELYSISWEEGLPVSPLSDLATLEKSKVTPAKLSDDIVHHYSLPAYDNKEIPEKVSPKTIKSAKTVIAQDSILVSRLNPRIDRTWWVEADDNSINLCSTEFACLSAPGSMDLAAVWLAVRNPSFLSEIKYRVTGTSGSHQRIRPNDLMTIEVPDFRKITYKQKAAALLLLNNRTQLVKETQKLESLRDALLPELMSGRIRVPQAQEAIAEVIPEEDDEHASKTSRG